MVAFIALYFIYRLWKSINSLQSQETEHIIRPKHLTGTTTNNHEMQTKSAEATAPPAKEVLRQREAKATTVLPKRVNGGLFKTKLSRLADRRDLGKASDFDAVQPIIFYTSLTTTTAQLAQTLHSSLFSSAETSAYPVLSIATPSNSNNTSPRRKILLPQLRNLEETEFDDFFVASPRAQPKTKFIYLILLPTYDPPESSPSYAFIEQLRETHHDFRVDTAPLKDLGGYAVFGVGDSSEWGDMKRFCRDAKEVDKWLGKLTGGTAGGSSRRIFPLGMGDCNPDGEAKGELEEQLNTWRVHLEESIKEYALQGELGESAAPRAAVESEDEESDIDLDDEADEEQEAETEMVDVEDIGRIISKGKKQGGPAGNRVLAFDFTSKGKSATTTTSDEKEMVPEGGQTYKALTKQGYTIVGSHSGVKVATTFALPFEIYG